MSDLRQAIDFVKQAESSLRDLMQQALEQQRYRDVGEIAPIADGLSELMRRSSAAISASVTSVPVHLEPLTTPPFGGQKPQPRATARDKYPQFKRDGDKLVKIAWSKKDRREYEHRAPREAVMSVVRRLASEALPGTAFTMDRFVPFKDSGGTEMPSYQAYLTLAWLRNLGLVEERGKEGYSICVDGLSMETVEREWAAITTRR